MIASIRPLRFARPASSRQACSRLRFASRIRFLVLSSFYPLTHHVFSFFLIIYMLAVKLQLTHLSFCLNISKVPAGRRQGLC
ncbi:MAG: hypothetical protein Q4P12_06805, partial [Bacteroidales bacterium]|nr:hypothetical protein [Bacteroidales bacterium]